MERFKLKDLPKDVSERLAGISFYKEEGELKGQAWLIAEWVFLDEDEETHFISFDSMEDLIDSVRHWTIKEE